MGCSKVMFQQQCNQTWSGFFYMGEVEINYVMLKE